MEPKQCKRDGCTKPVEGRKQYCSETCKKSAAYWRAQIKRQMQGPGEHAMKKYRTQNLSNTRARNSWRRNNRFRVY